MKNFSKLTLFVFLILTAALLGVSTYAFYLKRDNVSLSSKTTDATKAPAKLRQDVIKQYTDSLTKETHTAFTNKNANLPASSLSNGVVNKPLLDTISKALDIKSSQVTAYIKVNQVSEAKNLKAEQKIDSLKRLVYLYSNGFISIGFTTPDSIHKKGEFDYKYNQKIKATSYNNKKFLGIPVGQDIIDISSTDPNSKFGDLDAFSIRPKDRFFGAEIQALTSYNFRTQNVSPGVGAQVKLGRFYATPAIYFTPSTKQFNPVIVGRFAIFKTPK